MMEDTTRRSFPSAAITPNQLPYSATTLFHPPTNHIQQRLVYSASPHAAGRAAAPPDFPLKRERSPDETDGTPSSQISQIPPALKRHAESIGAASNGHAPDSSVNSPQSDDDEPGRKKQKRNKPTLSCFECVERKTKVTFFVCVNMRLPQPSPSFPTQVFITKATWTIQVANERSEERGRRGERWEDRDIKATFVPQFPPFLALKLHICVLVQTGMTSH